MKHCVGTSQHFEVTVLYYGVTIAHFYVTVELGCSPMEPGTGTVEHHESHMGAGHATFIL